MNRPDETPRWLDDPGNVTLLYRGLWVFCILLVVADFFYEKHAEFPIEEIPGFNAWFGFVGFALLVLSGKALRLLVMRDEDYYDE